MYIKRLTVGTSVVSFDPLSLGSGPQRNGIRVIADQLPDSINPVGNTGVIAIGTASTLTVNSSDTTDGHPIRPGDDFLLPIDTAKAVPLLYFIATIADQRISIISD